MRRFGYQNGEWGRGGAPGRIGTEGVGTERNRSGAASAARFAALVAYVFRACLPAKRLAALALPVGAIILAGVVANVAGIAGDHRQFSMVASGLIFGLALPLGALIVGDSVLGAEVRSGTLAFTWLTPVRHVEVAVARWLGGWLVCLATLIPACALAAVLADVGDQARYLALGAAAGTAAHVAMFIAIGAVARRAAMWSLGILFIVERLLGEALSGIAQLSPTWQGEAVYTGLADVEWALIRSGIPLGWDAVRRLALLTGVFLLVATWGLRRLKLAGSRD